jgi:hypothetical protein
MREWKFERKLPEKDALSRLAESLASPHRQTDKQQQQEFFVFSRAGVCVFIYTNILGISRPRQ